MNNVYDIIVAGVGSMGASTCYALAKTGAQVLGLEAHLIVNEESSHSGQTRIVRKAYFEHPDYVPLLESAYQGWQQLEQITGRQYYHPVGLAYFGKQGHPLLQSVRNSSEKYHIPLEKWDVQQSAKALPDFSIPITYETIFEPEAGFVCTDQVIAAYHQLATDQGAHFREHEPVIHWEVKHDSVIVHTAKEQYTCQKLILTGGAGNRELLPAEMGSLKVTRQLISWVRPRNDQHFKLGQLPCWVLAPDDEKGIFYGFPMIPETYGGIPALKVAHHFPGELYHESDLTPAIIETEKQKIRRMMDAFLPDVFTEFVDVTSCLYTYTEDENFIIDFVPETNQSVITAAGFSGHGFKFVPVIGEVLRDLVIHEQTDQPVRFLKANRN